MLELIGIQKRYQFQKVLEHVNMRFPKTGMIGIVGPSGCGKSTLLHIIGGLDNDFQGDILFNGRSVKKRLSSYRRKYISFIFQQLHLIMWLSVFSNIHLPHYFHKQAKDKTSIDISEFQNLKLSSLSLGQRQRLTYSRSSFHQKDIVLCDEPTGSLDPQNANEVMKQLYEESQYRLIIVVSHDLALIEKYCHEVYMMEDGHVKEHCFLKEKAFEATTTSKQKKMLFPRIRLSLQSLLSHKKQTMQLVFGLSLSLFCVLVTFTLSRTLETEIQKYFYSLIPPSMISFQSQNHQSLSLDDVSILEKREDIERVQLHLDDYELLGVGFEDKRYQESQTLFIGDDSSPYQYLQLKKGRYPSSKEEILVSYSTAKHLCQSSDIDELIGKKLNAWYKYQNEMKTIAYHVVGITQNTTVVDTLYQQNNSYIYLLQEAYEFDEFQSHFGIIYVDSDYQRSQVIESLKNDCHDYRFVESGQAINRQISQTMNQVEIVLLLFSVLAILSSFFLIGEVMFLNAVQKKKDYAIMMCFGARMKDLIALSICESLEILFISWGVVVILYYEFLSICEIFVKELFVENVMRFCFDVELLGMTFLFSLVLIFLSQFLPMIYTLRINTVETLKG